MPVSLMRNGLTAEKSLFSQKPNVKVPRSRFDLSRLNPFTMDFGMIVPVDVIPTIPNMDIDLGCQYKIDFRPLIVPPLTSYKVKVHYYFCPNEYLWSGWETFISKGRSGNLNLKVPQILVSDLANNKLSGLTDENFKTADGTYYPYSPMSLLGYMLGALPYDSDLTQAGAVLDHYLPYIDGSNSLLTTGWKITDVSALPFLMYQKIYRSNYLDPNLMSNGTVASEVWFPDDIDSTHWRINYAASNLGGSYNCFFVPDGQTIPSSDIRANFVPIPYPADEANTTGDNAVNLTQLRYAMYTDDMFTTALPFLQRGPQTSLDLNISDLIVSNNFSPFDLYAVGEDVVSKGLVTSNSASGDPLSSIVQGYDVSSSTSKKSLKFTSQILGSPGVDNAFPLFVRGSQYSSSENPSVSLGVQFTAQQLRDLIAVSVWQERNALTNGSYGQFIKVHFDSYPRNQLCEPVYIGGTTSVFGINSVLQTSASTDGGTPQGNPSGLGSSSARDSIGHFRSDDFGFILALMMIIPDTVYNQGSEHWMTDSLPDDFYMTEYERLSYQPILNKQLFVSGVDKVDNDLFGYSNRYVYMKQRDSIVRGRFESPSRVP